MTGQLYTAGNVADLLDLHVKTIRRYVRDGRLKARRIGKEYRITRHDLEEFTGAALTTPAAVPRTRHVIVSSIVDVDVVSPEESQRITTMLMATLNARRGEGDFPNVNSIYYPEQARLRIMITANPLLTTSMLQLIDTLLKDGRGRHL
jgi:excisionase family DNA binding protein